MDIELDRLIDAASDSNSAFAQAEIIPVVNKEDESFLLHEDKLPDEMPLLTLRDTVMFPGVITPIAIGRKMSENLVRTAERKDLRIVCVTQRDNTEKPALFDLYTYGVVGRVLRVMDMPGGGIMAVVQGTMKCQLDEIVKVTPYYTCKATVVDENLSDYNAKQIHILAKNLSRRFAVLEQHRIDNDNSSLKANIEHSLSNIKSDRVLINYIAAHLNIDTAAKQDLLDTFGCELRAKKMIRIVEEEEACMKMEEELQSRTRQSMDRMQREMYLSHQMRIIQDELGGNPVEKDIARLRKHASRKKMPFYAKCAFENSVERLSRMAMQSPDYTVELNYIELLLSLPWDYCSKDNLRPGHAKRVLNRDHYGLEKIKERIIEHIAVLKLRGNMKSPILCFVGPPGTGKTSLGKSIAEALGRPYVRMALGGLHDEAEIRGHRKTYVGAMPGRVLQCIKRAGVSNPVFVLDEIDKVNGMSNNGDPTSALLEVLDPEQNTEFHDNYLDVDYDLSHVLFIATANTTSTIQPALLDRMEVIDLNGYILEEKLEIAQRHLVPRELERHGLKKDQIRFGKPVLTRIINDYTRESGVRQLEKVLAKLIRHRAVQIAEGEAFDADVRIDELAGRLGLPIHNSERRGKEPKVGVVTGLAWTQVGGEILFVESSLSRGKGTLTMTGNLGDVMKESATLAFEYLKSNADSFGIDPEKIENSNLHIHVPEGATPKDGPSAGITMFVAMVSVFSQRKVKPSVAMTGEITLRGAVTPVGGIKEKILAAKRAEITDIILCEENRRDIEDIPQGYLKGLEFHYISEMSEALDLAFER